MRLTGSRPLSSGYEASTLSAVSATLKSNRSDRLYFSYAARFHFLALSIDRHITNCSFQVILLTPMTSLLSIGYPLQGL